MNNDNQENNQNIEIQDVQSDQNIDNNVDCYFNTKYVEYLFAEFITNILSIHLMGFLVICYLFDYCPAEAVFYFSFALDPFAFFFFLMERKQSQ